MEPLSSLGIGLIVMGLVIVLLGVALVFGPGIPFPGKLPGDIHMEWSGGGFYFPIATCIILSLLLSLILNFFQGGK